MQKTLVAALALFAVACGDAPVPVMQQTAIPRPPELPRVAYLDGTNAMHAVQQVRARVGEPFRVLEIRVRPDAVVVQAQDPARKENVDEYRVKGGVLQPSRPVRLFGLTSQKVLEDNLFNPDDVDLAVIPALVKEAEAKVQLEGRELSGVTVKRKLPFEEQVSIDVAFHGTRKSGYLHADRKGKHREVRVF
jgi:hypothetical protein